MERSDSLKAKPSSDEGAKEADGPEHKSDTKEESKEEPQQEKVEQKSTKERPEEPPAG